VACPDNGTAKWAMRGSNPRPPACKAGVVPSDQQPISRGLPETRTRTASVPGRCAARNTWRPSASRPGRTRTCAILLVRQASWPLDDGTMRVAEVGLEPTGTRPRAPPEGWSWRLCRFAYPAMTTSCGSGCRTQHSEFMRLGRAPAHPRSRRDTRPRYRAGRAGLMRAGRAPATPGDSAQWPRGDSNSHARCGHERLRLARLPLPPPGHEAKQPVRESNPPLLAENQESLPIDERAMNVPVRRDGVEPPGPEGTWSTATRARQCPADAFIRGPVARVGVEPTGTEV
jgi:hypothetical protein